MATHTNQTKSQAKYWIVALGIGLIALLVYELWWSNSSSLSQNKSSLKSSPSVGLNQQELAKAKEFEQKRDPAVANLISAVDQQQHNNHKNQILAEYEDPLIRTLFGVTDTANYRSIAIAADKIFDRANEQDFDVLLRYLDTPLLTSMSADEWRAIKTHIIDFITTEWTIRPQAEQALLSLLQRSDMDKSVKAAILNRMDKVYSQSSEPGKIENVLWQISDQPEDSLASGSLTALARINYHERAIDDAKLLHVAEEIAFVRDSEQLTKVTAIQLATMLEGGDVFPQALALVTDSQAPQMVKIAAITAVAKLGNPSAIKDLESVINYSVDPLVSKAAEAAIKQLQGQQVAKSTR